MTRGVLLLGLLLAGCASGPLRIEMAPSDDRVRWEQQITHAVNDLTTRLEALEARDGRADHPAQ